MDVLDDFHQMDDFPLNIAGVPSTAQLSPSGFCFATTWASPVNIAAFINPMNTIVIYAFYKA